MMRQHVLRGLVVPSICFALATIATGQERIFRPLPGAKQIGISGNWASAGGVSTYRLTIEGGYYLTDSLVAVARFGVIKQSPERRQFYGGIRYDLSKGGVTVPYLVAGIEAHQGPRPNSLIIDTGSPNSTFLQAGLGLNFFLNRHVAAYGELVDFRENGSGRTGADLQVGFRAFFK